MTNSERHELEVLTMAYFDARIGTFPEDKMRRMRELEAMKEREEAVEIQMDIRRTRVW